MLDMDEPKDNIVKRTLLYGYIIYFIYILFTHFTQPIYAAQIDGN